MYWKKTKKNNFSFMFQGLFPLCQITGNLSILFTEGWPATWFANTVNTRYENVCLVIYVYMKTDVQHSERILIPSSLVSDIAGLSSKGLQGWQLRLLLFRVLIMALVMNKNVSLKVLNKTKCVPLCGDNNCLIRQTNSCLIIFSIHYHSYHILKIHSHG